MGLGFSLVVGAIECPSVAEMLAATESCKAVAEAAQGTGTFVLSGMAVATLLGSTQPTGAMALRGLWHCGATATGWFAILSNAATHTTFLCVSALAMLQSKQAYVVGQPASLQGVLELLLAAMPRGF